MKKIIIAMLLSISCMATSHANQELLRIATDIDNSELTELSMRRSTEFDIDVVQAICQQMKIRCMVSNTSKKSLFTDLVKGKYDVILTSHINSAYPYNNFVIADLFTIPQAVYLAPTKLLLKDDSLLGKKVGVKRNSNYYVYLRNKYRSKLVVKTFSSTYDALKALSTGKVDYVLIEKSEALEWLQHHENRKRFAVVNRLTVDSDYFSKGYKLVVLKRNGNVLATFNNGLNNLKQNGTLNQLSNSYFGSSKIR